MRASDKLTRRKIRRAIGTQALDALTDMEGRSVEIDRFLLLRYSLRKRLWWLLTGRF